MKKQTVVSLGMSRDNNNVVRLRIEDTHSGDDIIEVSLSLKELGLLVTGLNGVKGVAEIDTSANIAKKREIKRVSCEKVSYNKEEQKNEVMKDFFAHWCGKGWMIHSDGTTSQQNTDKHQYIVKRYVGVENPLEVTRYY